MDKIKILLQVIKKFKNWHIFLSLYFKTIKKDTVVLETKNNLKMKIRTKSTDLMQLGTVWFTDDYKMPGFEINDNDTVIDIGAHVGLFSLFVSEFCKQGKIFSFEPIIHNYNLLRNNIELNGIKNIIPLNLAVSNNNESVKIYINSDDSAHSIFRQTKEFVEVNSITLEKIFEKYKIENCNFLKLDCEGAEYEIIESIPDKYFSKIDKMIIEYHLADKKPELFQNLIKKLEMMLFNIKINKISEDIGMIYAIKQDR